MKKIICLTFLCVSCLLLQTGNAQNFSVGGIEDAKSPQVASLMRIAAVPTQLNTGQINPKITLYNFSTPELNIPVELNYSNTGLKVDENATWVGHGWNLEVGGMITQNVRGISDFAGGIQSPEIFDRMKRFLAGEMRGYELDYYRYDVANGNIDSERDLFVFNFLGRSGSFFFDSYGTIQLISKQDLKITATINNNNLSSFTIYDENGVQYEFSVTEASSVSYNEPTSDHPSVINSVTWYLSKIVTPNSDEFNFNYSSYGFYSVQGVSEVLSFGASSTEAGCSVNYSLNGFSFGDYYQTINLKQLSSVTSKYGSINFTTSNIREDLIMGGINSAFGPALTEITVYNQKGNLVRKVGFEYGKFVCSIGGLGHQRLKLKTIKFMNSSKAEEEFSFKYYNETDNFPLIHTSKDFDHWGYYNGANNGRRVPNFREGVHPYNASFVYGANKNSNSIYSRYGMLKEIKYPTGGSTEFVYEANVVDISNNSELKGNPFFDVNSINQSNYEIGGNRIKKIIYRDVSTNVSNEKTFEYSKETSIKNVPMYIIDKEYLKFLGIAYVSCGITKYIYDKPLNSMPGFQIEYSSVTESNGNFNLGKTETFYLKSEYIGLQGSPFAPVINTSWTTGISSKKIHYLNVGNLQLSKIKEETFNYSTKRLLDMTLATASLKLADITTGNGYSPQFARYASTVYSYFSDFFYQSSISEKTFSGNNEFVVTKAFSYESDKHVQVTKQIEMDSKGQSKEIKYYYVPDFSNFLPNIIQLKEKGFVSLLRMDIFKNGKLLNSKANILNSKGKIVESKESEIKVPQAISSFDNKYLFQQNINYKSIGIYQYDLNNNLVASNSLEGINRAFIYGYKNSLIIAQVTNANYGSVAYTSFESDDTGNWTYSGSTLSDAITGRKSYYLASGNIDYTGLNASNTYTVSYWLKDRSGSVNIGGTPLMSKNGWTLYEATISGVSLTSISGNGQIDELRLFPKTAQMSTFTYEPLIGMTSKCDANNRIEYYEYDSFGRLKLIRDFDGNIIKSFNYQYQTPQ